jgi:hypothetical protein
MARECLGDELYGKLVASRKNQHRAPANPGSARGTR